MNYIMFHVKQYKIKMNLENFNPNDPAAAGSNIFGLPFTEDNAQLILIPIPWEATVSYRTGTANGPEMILQASMQVDLFDRDNPNQWKKGMAYIEEDEEIRRWNTEIRPKVEEVLDDLYEGNEVNQEDLKTINQRSQDVNQKIESLVSQFLEQNKKVGLIGGDHSTPLGIVKALAKKHNNFGVLQIDAHADLRKAYEGFTYSHASIMYNILEEVKEVKKLVQVGIRDYCDEEYDYIRAHPERIKTFFDQDIKEAQFEGKSWKEIVEDIINQLPQQIYISFDIDGLRPHLCPNTGTPVPGGFELEEVFYLFKKIQESEKEIIGFDLNETANDGSEDDTIDTISAARLIYKLANIVLAQNN